MQKPIQALMQKEMTRKEFIATLGFGAATVLGLSSVLNMLGHGKKNPFQGNQSLGYGSSAYGGVAGKRA